MRRELVFKALHGAVSGTEKAVHAGFKALRGAISHLEARDTPVLPPAHAIAPVDPEFNNPPDSDGV